VPRRDESERVAIRRDGRSVRSDDRLGTRPVLDDDGLIPSFEAFGQQARDVVGAAAGPVWNNLHRRGRYDWAIATVDAHAATSSSDERQRLDGGHSPSA
jgi:hypothetical protein